MIECTEYDHHVMAFDGRGKQDRGWRGGDLTPPPPAAANIGDIAKEAIVEECLDSLPDYIVPRSSKRN